MSTGIRDKLLVLLVALLAFGLVGELGLRIFLSFRTFYDVEMSRYGTGLKVRAANPRIGHVHRPDRRATLMDVEVRINHDGLRDDEHPRERGDARRLVFLGDSLTFGWGVAKEETFEHRLEKRLGAEQPTEIINFGTGNYNTTQEVQLFLEKGLAYRPDGVVLFYFINDAEPLPVRSRWWWLGHSRLVTFYWSRIKALSARFSPSAGFAQYYQDLYGEDQPGWRETRASFLELRDACRYHGIRLQVVMLPELHQLDPYGFEREHALVRDFLEGQGIDVLDLAPRFATERDPMALWVARDDAHPNARGHALIAHHSYAEIREMLP